MSIELLPADPIYPSEYHVRPNYCQCHPETCCCCKDWAVFDQNGNKFSTHYEKGEALKVASTLNNQHDIYQHPVKSVSSNLHNPLIEGETMKSFELDNQAKLVTEVFDKDGNMLWRLTREYGEVLPTEEAMALEQALLDLGKQLAKG